MAPDPIFGSTLVEKFVNSLMWEGRKAVAQRVFYAAMNKVGEKSGGHQSSLGGAAHGVLRCRS